MSETTINPTAAGAAASSRRTPTAWTAWQIDAIGLLLFVAITAAFWYLGILPALAAHEQARAEQHEYVAAQHRLGEAERAADMLNRQFKDTRQAAAAQRVPLQPVSQLNQRLAQLTEAASRAGTRLDDIQPGKLVAGTRYDVLPIHLSGTGAYGGVTALLHEIRSQYTDMGVGAMTTSGSPTAAANNDATTMFTIELSWYTQHPTERGNGGSTNK